MTDPFRISSGDGRVPDFSTKKTHDHVIRKIRLMDPSTAYVAVQGVVVPTLNRLQKNFAHLSETPSRLSSPMSLSTNKLLSSSPFIESTKSIDKIKANLTDIQARIIELKKHAKEILDLRIDYEKGGVDDTKITYKDLWTYPNDNEFWNNPESHGGIFGRFFALRGIIEKRVADIQKEIKTLEKNLPGSPLIKTLREAAEGLLKNIPKPSDKWNTKDRTYDGKAWKFKWRDSGSLWWVAWDEYTKNKGSPNSIGLLELVQDPKKLNEYLSGLTKGLQDIQKFTSTRDFHLLKLQSLDTQSAYMYLITVMMPFLQTESAEALEEQGETMKQVSKLYDKWNEIQDEINKMTVNIREVFKDKIIKDQKVDFWNIIDYKDYKVGKFNDPKQIFNGLLKSKTEIDKKIEEFQKLLQDVEKKLPPSAQSLIETLKELAPKLKLNQSDDFNFYYWNEQEMRFEILSKDANLKDNEDYGKMSELLIERLEKVYGIFINSDQTKFKAYMDNIAQGITALTSISNMTQQELQIATQYYNSLLGLQKTAFDSLNKVIQVATKNPNY